jgi:hypothetical protein
MLQIMIMNALCNHAVWSIQHINICMESWRVSTGNVDYETGNYADAVKKRMIVLQITRRCFLLACGWLVQEL